MDCREDFNARCNRGGHNRLGVRGKWIKGQRISPLDSKKRLTDDTVLTAAVAAAILGRGDYANCLRKFARRHPGRGYGGYFHNWLSDDSLDPYNSWGNGSAMRVSPVGWAFDSVEKVLGEAARSAEVTHNHPEGIRGAQAVALSIYFARCRAGRLQSGKRLRTALVYDLARTADEIRSGYSFDVSCQGSVPESIICFLESESYESSVRLAISLGGDADTMACMTGAIGAAYYGGVPGSFELSVHNLLTPDLLEILDQFRYRYCTKCGAR